MLDFTFLSKDQILGDNALDIFKKRGAKAPLTDLVSVLGAGFAHENYYMDIPALENRTTDYWTSTISDDSAIVISMAENTWYYNMDDFNIGCRPAIKYSEIKNDCSKVTVANDGVLEAEFGEYPQNAVSEDMQENLNLIYSLGTIKQTGAAYSFGKRLNTNANSKNVEFVEYKEYEYKGKKYIRVKNDSIYTGLDYEFTNGINYEDGDYVWIEVAPVKWLVDEKEDIAISERVLFSNIIFHYIKNYKGDFNGTNIKKYLNKKFAKNIIPSNIKKEIENNYNEPKENNKSNSNRNTYEFDFKEVSEEELIKASLESNIAPFLHGKSSDGKSARIKQFDPDAEIVYLRNATPDSLNGKSVYNAEKNEMIDVPPTWYVKLKEKCDAEPDKLHIVFFDELTNALPSIQGMAFNIILDKEINGKWKLPENARVAAAGNDLEDSLAANTMAEPLFNRFNHVYIKTTLDSWLNWAILPDDSYERLEYKKEDTTKQFKIHPAIYAYISCKREAVLRTKYTGITPNADPRKWEMASKVLYKTNNPYMLRGLIGEALAEDFAAFCKTKVISITDVINGNYDNKIFEIDSSEKYLTALALSNVDEDNLEVVRKFIENLGEEFLALFDSLWTIGDDERLEKLMSLKQGKVKLISL